MTNDAYEFGVHEGMKKVAFFGPSIHPFSGVGTPNVSGLLKKLRGSKGATNSGIGASKAHMAAVKAGQ